jgi:hypothetical protein
MEEMKMGTIITGRDSATYAKMGSLDARIDRKRALPLW